MAVNEHSLQRKSADIATAGTTTRNNESDFAAMRLGEIPVLAGDVYMAYFNALRGNAGIVVDAILKPGLQEVFALYTTANITPAYTQVTKSGLETAIADLAMLAGTRIDTTHRPTRIDPGFDTETRVRRFKIEWPGIRENLPKDLRTKIDAHMAGRPVEEVFAEDIPSSVTLVTNTVNDPLHEGKLKHAILATRLA
jgi:hypothetical protein